MNTLVKKELGMVDSIDINITEKIKQWNSIELKLKYINEKTKELRENKHKLTEEIVEYLDRFSTPPKITIGNDYQIQVYDKKETTSLSFTYIEKCLGEILKDKSQIDFIVQYLKNHRETVIIKDIRRTQIKLEKFI